MSVSHYLKCFAKFVGFKNPLCCPSCDKSDKTLTKELRMGAGVIYHCARCNVDFYFEKEGEKRFVYSKECSPFGMAFSGDDKNGNY